MTTSLAAEGMLALSPALAVMLGANIGTALIVKVLSFDVSWVAPLLLIAGYVAFWRGRRGIAHDLGRVGIGLGLMLLALHQLVATIEPVQTAPVLGALLGALTREPLLDLAFAALLTWAAHSSVAVMLLLASLAGANVITPVAAIALVLGANLGGTIPPVLEATTADPGSRRLPVGNLAFRALGCVAVLPFAHPIAEALWRFTPEGKRIAKMFADTRRKTSVARQRSVRACKGALKNFFDEGNHEYLVDAYEYASTIFDDVCQVSDLFAEHQRRRAIRARHARLAPVVGADGARRDRHG